MAFSATARLFAALMIAALAACSPSTEEPTAAASEGEGARPANIIILMADDLGYADVSTYGIQRISTPNIDRIGKEGVIFTDGYSTAPVCSPSRAAVQTGRYQQRFGFEFNNGPARRDDEEGLGLDPREITLGAALSQAGYATGLIGKWHLGSRDEFYPTNRGYGEFVGFLPGATSYIDRSLPGVRHADNPRGEIEGGRALGRNQYTQVLEGPDRTIVQNENEYLTEYFARRAADFVSRHSASEDPYFLYVAFNAPHDPLTVTQKYYDRFSHIETEHHRIYAAMVSALDDAVGAILEAVEKSGEADDTLIVFISDNGCAAYYEGMCACEPMRGGKLSHYEGGVRIPFVMRWPSEVKAGQIFRHPVSTLDLFPTAMAAARAPLPADRAYDGVDLAPFLSGRAQGAPHDQLTWRRAPMTSIRKGDWKLWKHMDGEFTLLFNLREDPNEQNNLAMSRPEVVSELEGALAEWGKDLTDPTWPSRPHVSYNVCGTPFELPI